jgi:lysine biosynthesis protein LysW
MTNGRTRRTLFASCPGCDNDIYFDRLPELGTFVTCPECGDLVEVVDLSPLTLDWSADFDDEDWPDYEDDFGDFDDADDADDADDFRDDYADDFAADFDEGFAD